MLRQFSYIVIALSTLSAHSQLKQTKKYFDSDSVTISEIFTFSLDDSTLQGAYEAFYQNGSLKTFGWYDRNQPDSIWTYYYENGRKKAEGTFKTGTPKGFWKYYYENGNIKSEGVLEGTSKEGLWNFYYETKGNKSSGNYQNNEKIGIWNYFFEDGSIKAQTLIQGGSGNYLEFYPSGSRRMEGENVSDKSQGEWIYYYESGEIEAIGNFSEGQKNGLWEYFHKNGKTEAQGNYAGGNRQGEWKYYHENGELSQSGFLRKDKKDGYWKLFYPTGELQREAQYENGNGQLNEYYPSGNRKASGAISEGKKSGKWLYYSDFGHLEGEATLDKGEGQYTGYYPDGKVKMKGLLKEDKRVGEWTLYNPDQTIAGTYRPIYENEKPIFKTRVSEEKQVKETIDKPNYHPEKRGLRYFLPRVNEYKGIIIATNPLWLLNDQIPVSIEYYIQERLGYELQIDVNRSPFFTPDDQVDDYQVYRRGAQLHFRQKFYHSDTKSGMFYFGHELNFKYQNSQVNHVDTLIIQQPRIFGNLVESSYGYSILIGNRWMRDAGKSGITIDVFLGAGIAARSFRKQYEDSQVLDNYFDQEIKSTIHFPVSFGLNIGFAATKSKSKTQ
ncbi:MAG: hypothetical protein HRT61_19315 [Ekhidna sp.]|nr:hypothetical protein [Ekhidna sp.]